jgi:hypothetical protein
MDYLIARPVTCQNTMQYCPVKPLHHLVKISGYRVAFVSVNKYRNYKSTTQEGYPLHHRFPA